jgi:hypothetical protein
MSLREISVSLKKLLHIKFDAFFSVGGRVWDGGKEGKIIAIRQRELLRGETIRIRCGTTRHKKASERLDTFAGGYRFSTPVQMSFPATKCRKQNFLEIFHLNRVDLRILVVNFACHTPQGHFI